MKTKVIFCAILLVAGLNACKSLDLIESKPISEEVEFTRYNSESKLRFNVYNSDTSLKLVFSTNDRASQAKILKAGLTIYFDDQGKKSELTFVNFPMNSSVNGAQEKPPKGEVNLTSVITQIPQNMVYSFKGAKQNLAIHEGDIQTNIYAKGQELFYELQIPFSRISHASKSGLFEVNIGVRTGTLEIPQLRSGMSAGGQRGGGGGSMGGRGGGYPRGGGNRPTSGNRPDMQDIISPIDFWFTAVIN
jgi:uncharacterized membrane protein YgcG